MDNRTFEHWGTLRTGDDNERQGSFSEIIAAHRSDARALTRRLRQNALKAKRGPRGIYNAVESLERPDEQD